MSWRAREAYSICNRVRLIIDGGAYFDRMEALIDGARTSIHLQVYIFANDHIGARIGASLLRAAQRGVRVFLLVDGYGSQGISDELVRALRDAGAHVGRFEPLFRSRHFYIGRRLHQKVLVVDDRYGLTGGRNITDRYAGVEGTPAWYDMALEVEGEAALDLSVLCCVIWNSAAREPQRARASPPTEADRNALRTTWPPAEHCAIRVRYNDWLYRHVEITRSYSELFTQARSEIILMSSYFIPGRTMKWAIARALRRGVRVVVILGGRSDIWIARSAERWLYAWLLRQGAEVYEYDPTVLHAKVATRDGQWATLGSFNINDLSAYTTLEVNLDVNDPELVATLRTELERIMRHDCRRITTAGEERNGPWRHLGQWIAYWTLQLVNRLITFYYRQEP